MDTKMALSNRDPIELLQMGDEGRVQPFIHQYWPYIFGTFCGVGAGVMINYGTRRPLLSGIQKHVVGVAGFCTVYHFLWKKRNDYYAERDAVYKHYVKLHPEDFPPPHRKLIGEMIEPWIPIR